MPTPPIGLGAPIMNRVLTPLKRKRTVELMSTLTSDQIYARYVAKYGKQETTSEYLARTAHLVDPDPRAGTDWEGVAR